MTSRPAIVCRYERAGHGIRGVCPELGLETPLFMGRDAAESALVKLVTARLGADHLRCFVHAATVDALPGADRA